MRAFVFASLSLFALSAYASPSKVSIRDSTLCLTDAQATTVADGFKSLIDNYSTASADAVLTSDFVDYSDSVSEVMNSGCPTTYGTATFSSRAAFEASQSQQPNIPFQILNVWHDCTTVIVRWKTSNPGATVTPVEPVVGIAALVVVEATDGPQDWQISTVYSEFNSAAWLYDLGICTPTCS